MSRTSLPVVLSDAELVRLEQWIRAGSTPQQVVLRCQIIRGAAQGETDKTTAATLRIRRETAALWRRRVREQGIGCVWEIAAGRGRKPRYAAARVGQWILTPRFRPSRLVRRTGARARWPAFRGSAKTRFSAPGRITG